MISNLSKTAKLLLTSVCIIMLAEFYPNVPIPAQAAPGTDIFQWVDWSTNIPNIDTQLLGSIQVRGNRIWLTSDIQGALFYSQDSGETFHQASANRSPGPRGIYMAQNGNLGWGVGQANVFRTDDGGVTWVGKYIQASLEAVHFPTDQIGYAVGNTVSTTSDGGQNWEKKTFPKQYVTLAAVFFPNPSNPDFGYVGVANSDPSLYITTDGGDSWTPVNLGELGGGINSIDFISPDRGWAAGFGGKIYAYTYGTWTRLNSDITVNLNSISFSPGGVCGCAAGESGTLLCTQDGGSHWQLEAAGMTNEVLTGVDVVSCLEAYAVGYRVFLRAKIDLPNNTYIPLIIR